MSPLSTSTLMAVDVSTSTLTAMDVSNSTMTTKKVSTVTMNIITMAQRARVPEERREKEMKGHVRIQTMSFMLLSLSTWFGSNQFVLVLYMPISEHSIRQ